MADTINITIEDDGTVSFNTDKISAMNHVSADDFLAECQEQLGGIATITKKEGAVHAHTHEHVHAGHKH